MRRLSLRAAFAVVAVALTTLVTWGGMPPLATAQQPPPGPAPTEDRVGFPEGYRETYTVMFVLDRPDNKQVRVIYGNSAAVSGQYGAPFPYGSIMVMETWSTKKDEAGNVLLDANERYERDALQGVFVQRKEPGFGEAYGVQRSGEWEYVAFRPDGSYSSPPQNTNACASCHQDAGKTRDWSFRTNLFFLGRSGAVPTAPPGLVDAGRALVAQYVFLPGTAPVKRGTTLTWANEDEAVHTIVADDGSFGSGRLGLGATFSHTFETVGTVSYSCTIHPSMKAQVVVID
ncbi:MAG: cytochrome P460 family protein [Chloroflexi bacterium]|nr:cytochrome P460 family protein [Chloroflexota bacterium]